MHPGHDLYSLLFAYMDEFLYEFSTTGMCVTRAEISNMDLTTFEINVKGYIID